MVGGGGREHALSTSLMRDPSVRLVCTAPGNPGIRPPARRVELDPADLDGLESFAEHEQIDLTVVGPELPLSLGIVDRFTARGLRIFGPSRDAARLETSKAFAKSFMRRHHVPSARFEVADRIEDALRIVRAGDLGFPLVIKADGLAAGKGVVIAADGAGAEAAVYSAMSARAFGSAGDRVVIEEHLRGPEVSFFVVSDGRHAVPIGTAQDHKRLLDGDRGPNTGGMGAIAPSPLVDRALEMRIMRDIVQPTIEGMAAEGYPFRGFLYAGLMLTETGPQVIEFNARLGDPETQVLLPLVHDPLAPILAAASSGALDRSTVESAPGCCAGVVLASAGYPFTPSAGCEISGIDQAGAIEGVEVFHAGTKIREGRLISSGGRVLTVIGRGSTYSTAIERAYAGVGRIRFEGMQYRCDIGRAAVSPE